MNNDKKVKLFLVDDDAVFSKFLEIELLRRADFAIETYPTGERCVANLSGKPDLIILDYHLANMDKNAMNGMETLDKIKSIDSDISVVMLSSQDEIDVAVNCLCHDAIDYVAKDQSTFLRLQNILSTIFSCKKTEKKIDWYQERA